MKTEEEIKKLNEEINKLRNETEKTISNLIFVIVLLFILSVTKYVNNFIRENEEKPGLKYKNYFKNELYTVGYTKGPEALNMERIVEEYRTI